MSEPHFRIEVDPPVDAPDDVDMGEEDEAENNGDGHEVEPPTGDAEAEADAAVEEATQITQKPTFLDYLKSPIIELGIGTGDDAVVLSAHQALLARSPFFVTALAEFSEDVTSRRIDMPSESLESMGCFLEYLYTDEYYPKRQPGNRLELGGNDDGVQLLKHARVYTLAEKLGVSDLANLALSKVHLVQSTAKGEIEYARYVYGHTPKTDARIRKPIASFWGARSHVLRHEAEDEFKQLCIEYPEFAFDVLTHVLDSKEKRSEKAQEQEAPKSGRKRQRNI